MVDYEESTEQFANIRKNCGQYTLKGRIPQLVYALWPSDII